MMTAAPIILCLILVQRTSGLRCSVKPYSLLSHASTGLSNRSVLGKIAMANEVKDSIPKEDISEQIKNRASAYFQNFRHVWDTGFKNAKERSEASTKNQFLLTAQVVCCVAIIPGSAACEPIAGWFLDLTAFVFLAYGLLLMGSSIQKLMIDNNLSFASEPVSDQIVMTGPYDVVRHPLYGGAILACLGLSLLTNDVWRLLITLGLFLASNERVLSEERYLVEKFGTAYDQYAKSVNKKLLPLIF